MKVQVGSKSLYEATFLVQSLVADPKADLGMPQEEVEALLADLKAGRACCAEKAVRFIAAVMHRYSISVHGMRTEEAAWEIYKYLWGMDVIEELYHAPEVDEIRVNDAEHVYFQERGRNRQARIKFKDDEHVFKIVRRMLEHDRISLDEGNPGVESRRLDGSRITALCPPLTDRPCFVVRKHGTFDISDENYLQSGTMDRYTMELFKCLVKGRANILISGGTGSGKTTLLRWLVKHLDPRLRIVTLETDRELVLQDWYPERDIVALEAHPEIGWDMRRCFTIILRLTPDVIIVGEARGLGEAGQMIEACRRGHDGSMGTIHVGSPYEAVTTLAQMALEEGRRLPVELLERQVASAFNVVVHMYGNNVSGVKKVEHVVEVSPGDSGPVFRDLCVWQPSEANYEEGTWVHPQFISEALQRKLFKYGVSMQELEELVGLWEST
ncbi:ATPase, T2SS/T4P/T4SS family [Moorellaceae bacterium AZ2]